MVWKTTTKEGQEVEVCYVGTHEGAEYNRIRWFSRSSSQQGRGMYRHRAPDVPCRDKKRSILWRRKKKGKDDEGKVEWDEVFPDAHPGVILRGAREMENLSQVALAKMINVHRGNISAMEVGVRKISVNMAKRLAEALNCNYKIFL